MSQNFSYALGIMPDAVTRLQALRRGKQARKRADALRSNRIRDRYAYQSYLGSHEQMNAQNLKAEEVEKATRRTLTRISAWTNMDGAEYTLLVEWKTNIVAKVIATAILD